MNHGCTAGTQPRHPELSGHCRTHKGPELSWASQDPNRDIQSSVGTADSNRDIQGSVALPDPKREVQSSAGPNRDIQSSVGTAGPQPQDPELNGHCRTPSGKSRAQWALPDPNRDIQSSVDPNRNIQSSVGTAGPQAGGHCRTPSATSRAQCALPDPNRDIQISMGLMSNTIACQKECQKECEIEWQKRMSEWNRMSEHICHIYIYTLPDEMSETMTK